MRVIKIKEENMWVLLAAIVVFVVLSIAAWVEIYKYKDCKKVGHKAFYCILNVIR